MKMDTTRKSLTDWDWTTLVASWRYYEHRHTITSSTFPHEIVGRFFLGAYDGQSCKRIARQFVGIDHLCGPDDEMDGWAGNEECDAIYRRAWRMFYYYLKSWLCGFKTAKVMIGGKSERVDVFLADGGWYAREGYEKYGTNVSPYKDGEIEFE